VYVKQPRGDLRLFFCCQGMALFSIEEFFADPKNGTLENK
jgi:hypothetical protein